MEKIEIDGVELIGLFGVNDRLAGVEDYISDNVWSSFIPDTILGLSIRPVCSLYEDYMVHGDPLKTDFVRANEEFYSNLIKWIKAKSNIATVGPRLAEAYRRYLFIKKHGWIKVAECKSSQGLAVC